MAGIKQHFIPQLLQRGFEASKSGKHSQVWVFRKGQAAYKSSTEGVAAQRHFYAEPSLDEDALDNIITRYEKDVLTPAVDGLRNAPLGQVEPEAAASVVSHLSIRAAFVRGAFSEITKKFLDHMSQVLATDESARAYMGIDSVSKDSMIEKTINESLAEDVAMLPETARHRLGRMVRFRFREHFHADFTSMAGMFDMQIERFVGVTSSAIENGHIRMLEREIVPLKRTELLKSLHWKLVLVPENSHVILPDCLALASDHADLSRPIPYTLADDETLASVLMPVSSSRVLVGSRTDVVIDWKKLNSLLAQDFFISSRNDMEMVGLAQHIGHAVSNHSQRLLEKDAFDAPSPYPERSEPTAARLVSLVPIVEFLPGSPKNGAVEAAIRAQMRAPELAPYLDQLRAVVVVPDVAAALTQRGVPLNEYGQQQVQFGACQSSFTPEGFVCEVFVPTELAQLMVNAKAEHARSASALVRHHLGRAVYMHFFAGSVSQQEVQESRGQLENLLLGMAQLAASHYFGARLSSPQKMGTQEFQMADALQSQAMSWSLEGLSRVREQYLAEPDVDKLLLTLAVFTEALFTTAASGCVLRHVNPTYWESGKCAEKLEAAGLLNWFYLLSRDMDSYFVARDTWASLAELEFLTVHAERILWGFGFYLSPAGNQIRVDVGNDQELAMLTKLISGARFPERRQHSHSSNMLRDS
jgi:hypothetical protein